MAGDRWEVMQELFDQALDLPEGDQKRFLRERCGGDLALQEAVEGLLQSDQRGGEFMPRLLDRSSLGVAAVAEDETRLGPYRLLRQLGEGGMGAVYLAERADAAFARKVVLKLIRRGMESAETRRRLRRERKILAGLVHPNIARMYDGGTSEENLPYFVMEWVEGVAIDAYCEERQLRLAHRLDLFRKVCAAVHHAHQNLVIHRDLKPSNILVTQEGEPKLLDFGIAKLLVPDPLDDDAAPTLPWSQWWTPNYASPEQILNQQITTASDVYSLGVLLFKLLTGALPRLGGNCSPAEVERLLLEQSPTSPSEVLRRLEKEALEKEVPAAGQGVRSKQLKGDLDTIVLKALERDPKRRYQSVEQLSEDVLRSQQGFPVRARPDDSFYRLRKFIRRHRLGLLVATAFLALLLSAAVTLTMQSAKIVHERDQLRAVLSFVKEVFKVAAEGEDLTVRQAVDRSAVILERRLTDQPEVRATLLDTTGSIYLNLWATDQARSQLAQAVQIRRRLYGDQSLEFAESLSSYALALAYQGEGEEGESKARQALALVRQELGNHHQRLVQPLNNLVDLLCYQSDFRAAEDLSIEALSLARKLLPEEREEVTTALANRALLLANQEQHQESAQLYRQALKLGRRYLGDEHPRVWGILNNLALGLKRQEKFDQAQEYYLQAVALERRLFGDENPRVAVTLNNLAKLQLAMGDATKAVATFREARQVSERAFGKVSPGYVYTSAGLASALIAMGDPQAATTLLNSGLEHWRPQLDGSWFLAQVESVLGEGLAALGEYREAEVLLLKSYGTLGEIQGAEHPRTREALGRVISLYRVWGKPEKLAAYEALQVG